MNVYKNEDLYMLKFKCGCGGIIDIVFIQNHNPVTGNLRKIVMAYCNKCKIRSYVQPEEQGVNIKTTEQFVKLYKISRVHKNEIIEDVSVNE